jgi:hypothetical protein
VRPAGQALLLPSVTAAPMSSSRVCVTPLGGSARQLRPKPPRHTTMRVICPRIARCVSKPQLRVHMKLDFQCVQTTSIRGFMAFGRGLGTWVTMLVVPAGLKSDFQGRGAGPRPESKRHWPRTCRHRGEPELAQITLSRTACAFTCYGQNAMARKIPACALSILPWDHCPRLPGWFVPYFLKSHGPTYRLAPPPSSSGNRRAVGPKTTIAVGYAAPGNLIPQTGTAGVTGLAGQVTVAFGPGAGSGWGRGMSGGGRGVVMGARAVSLLSEAPHGP